MNVLGADVGGTSTRLVLYDDDREIARIEGAGGPMRAGSGLPLAIRLGELGRPLLIRAGIVRADTFVVGAAGAGRDSERIELQAALEAQRLAWKVIVTSDAELARAAAFEGGPGVLLIAGTGSIAIARDHHGVTRRVGGLGWRMGDQGSGYWLGQRGLEAVGAMHDGVGPVTRLAETLCATARVAGIMALVRWSVVAPPADIAALGPAVLTTAADGDAVASELRDAAVDILARLAIAAGAGALPVALSGGLLAPDRALRMPLISELNLRGVPVIDGGIDPCRGAVVMGKARRGTN